MSGLYYLIAVIAMLVIVTWFIRNDGRTNTTGLLAIKPPKGESTLEDS
jgi:hypothetical protein